MNQTTNQMKQLKSLLMIILLSCSVASFAAPPTFDGPEMIIDNETKEKIHEEIQQLLAKKSVEQMDECTAIVRFTLNRENEVVVLEVKTENDELESLVKSTLNYKTLSTMIPKDVSRVFTFRLRSQ